MVSFSRVKLQCTYALAGLHRLFSVYKFDSDTEGVGQIVHPAQSPEGRGFSLGWLEKRKKKNTNLLLH